MNVTFRRHSRRSRRFYTDDGRALLVLPPHTGLASPSAALNQAALRARQLIALLRRELDYNAFFNTLWLILNDVTIGFAVASFLNENDVNALLAHRLEPWLVHNIHDYLHWLDSWPAGLKLNTELSRLYAHSLALLSHAFSHLVRLVVVHFQFILLVASFTSYIGASFALALLIDFVSLLTVHITLSYAISRIVYRRMILAARSLFNLFRGKRYNVLRHRTDYWEYDMDQLLLGTILFTLLAFLSPTVFVYYALFAALRVAILLLFASIEILIAFLNHFPLFALVLRIKDPERIPGSIYVELSTEHPKHLLVLKSQPLPLSIIFSRYIQLASRLATHYNPLRLLYQLFIGEYLAPIPYS
ncbi:N-acetylglucosaminyl transferase component-domain-containing protein [Amanita rubescens]|nr:N-acetylglucosaminyl transferase component-domain-containing protein [Amanita rubescens]